MRNVNREDLTTCDECGHRDYVESMTFVGDHCACYECQRAMDEESEKKFQSRFQPRFKTLSVPRVLTPEEMVIDQIDKEIFKRECQIEKNGGYDCYNHFDVEMLGEIHGLKIAKKILDSQKRGEVNESRPA